MTTARAKTTDRRPTLLDSRGGRGARVGARALASVGALGLFVWSSPSRADTLSYEAPSACGSREALVASVRARTPRARFEPGSAGRTFRIVVVQKEGTEPFAGSLVVEGDGSPTVREVDGTTCAEVADALALVVALTIDPNASIAPEPVPIPPEEPPPTVPAAPPAWIPPSAPPLIVRPAKLQHAPEGPVAIRLALEGVVGFGVAKSPSFGGALDLGLARTADEARHGIVVAPAGHLRASVASSTGADAPSADTVRAIVALDACPIATTIGAVRSEACAGLAVGAARFRGVSAPRPSGAMRPWAHLEAALVTTLALGRTAFVAVRGALEVPLTRDEIVFVRPDVSVQRAAAIAGSFGAALGLRL